MRLTQCTLLSMVTLSPNDILQGCWREQDMIGILYRWNLISDNCYLKAWHIISDIRRKQYEIEDRAHDSYG